MSKKIWFILLNLVIIAILALTLSTNTVSYVAPAKEQIEPISEPLATLHPKLVPVCACESGQGKNGTPKQFNPDGSVRFGKINPLDTGMCQINQKYWLEKSKELGFDIFTEQGNIKMANWIYDRHGLQPWDWSKSCWQ